MDSGSGNRALIAIFVSRFEAIEIASMLRGYGLHASIDGEAHAATEYITMAFGGHRLYVFSEDYEAASQILRECGVEHDDRKLRPPGRALKWLVGMTAAGVAAFLVPSVWSGAAPAWLLGYIPMSIYSLPVDPKGKPDYFLAESED